MQNKGAIRLFALLLTAACIYYIMFTFKTKGVEDDAHQNALSYVATQAVTNAAKAYANGDAGKETFFNDSVMQKKEDRYLDSMKKEFVYSIGITKFTYEKAKEQEINLGLDLRGGMNVTLEISVADIIRQMSNNSQDKPFNQALAEATKLQGKSTKDFVTLFGEEFKKIAPTAHLAANFQTIELKGKIDYNTKDEDVLALIRTRVNEAIDVSETTLRARIDKFGVTQPSIQKLEASGRILVELPGVKDKERVRKLLQGTANLEFWQTYDNTELINKLVEVNKKLAEVLNPKSDTTATDSLTKTTTIDSLKKVTASKPDSLNKLDAALNKTNNGDTTTKLPGDTTAAQAANSQKENPLFTYMAPNIANTDKGQKAMDGPVIGFSNPRDTAKINFYFKMPVVKRIMPANLKLVWSLPKSAENSLSAIGINKDAGLLALVALKVTDREGKAALYGDIIVDARKESNTDKGGFGVSMTMTTEAGQIWKRLTKESIGKSIAVILDNSAYSWPNVISEIPNGMSSITGDFSVTEANDLANVLKAGKLPAPAHIVAEETVGPTLGKEAISSGLKSFIYALLLVLVFMAFYYNKAGVVADIALFFNVFFVMGVLASLGAVLTLPGIAGIVLTIGMSVDANILIFERIREELASGKGVALAIKEGFSNAMSSILDSNVTTLLLGIILYMFGTGPIQGFATTLIIGILTSLFSAIFITRLIFEWMLGKNQAIGFSTKLTEKAFKNININFVAKRKLYYIFSSIIITLGVVFYFQKGFNLGVDFKGGRTYVVRFQDVKESDAVRNALKGSFNAEPEVKTYGESNQLKITTAYLIEDGSADAEAKVEERLKEGLNTLNTKYEIMSSVKVGETVSQDIKSKAIWAVLFSCLIMFVYIFIRFKKWQYGLGAVAALFHDVLVVLSCYTIFDGMLPFSLEINQDFIAAILTVMGYSMTDTVVVFDRIREYLADKNKTDLFGDERNSVINYALNSTLSRTINTSLTIFFVLLAIFVFGGATIKGFSFALLIGIVIGTYSSICIATPIVIDFEKNKGNSPDKK